MDMQQAIATTPQRISTMLIKNKNRRTLSPIQEVCMKGSVGYDKKMGRWYVSWYVAERGRSVSIWHYKGLPIRHRDLADRLLSVMRSDLENGTFRLEKYTKRASEIIPFIEKWYEIIQATLSPATQRDYSNSIKNHLIPYYLSRPELLLQDIQHDNLIDLLNSINRSGKGKQNVMFCLHACLKFAKRSRRIDVMPDFPEKKQYNIVEPIIQWLPSSRQEAVISAIPPEHQPIFWFLKYHLRRPSEACAIFKEDYRDGIFTVRRSFSNKLMVDRTKTGRVHLIPCVSSFRPYLEMEIHKQKQHGIVSPYLFVNVSGKQQGRHYTLVALEKLWARACMATGEQITMYAGLKHSTASQMINERGYTLDEIQIAGDWERRESVQKYAKVEIQIRQRVLEGKTVPFRTISGLKLKGGNQ
jgi:integrase